MVLIQIRTYAIFLSSMNLNSFEEVVPILNFLSLKNYPKSDSSLNYSG